MLCAAAAAGAVTAAGPGVVGTAATTSEVRSERFMVCSLRQVGYEDQQGDDLSFGFCIPGRSRERRPPGHSPRELACRAPGRRLSMLW